MQNVLWPIFMFNVTQNQTALPTLLDWPDDQQITLKTLLDEIANFTLLSAN